MLENENGNGKRTATVYDTYLRDKKRARFNVKKRGIPFCATYSPDGRTLFVATDRGIFPADPRTLETGECLERTGSIPDMLLVYPNGRRILNYEVSFTYDVAPGFSAQEDFPSGKYHVEQSGAASSMLKIVRQAFAGDLEQYLGRAKKVRVKLAGSADATPIRSGLPYDGSFGDFDQKPVYVGGQLTALSVDSRTPVRSNEQLAFLRAMAVRDFLEKNVPQYDALDKDYRYEVTVSEGKGSEFRRITAEFTFVDVF